jgi:hypothetical protein
MQSTKNAQAFPTISAIKPGQISCTPQGDTMPLNISEIIFSLDFWDEEVTLMSPLIALPERGCGGKMQFC